MRLKAFTMAEIIIVMTIIGFLAVLLMVSVRPDKFRDETNLANARKAIEFINQASASIMDLEKEQCPAGKFMVKPAGAATWEFALLDSEGKEADSDDIAELFGNHLKYETSVGDFCAATGNCIEDVTISGAKVIGDVYIGFEKFEDIQDCPAYRIPGESADTSAPTKFNPKTGAQEALQCWGRLYIDVDYKDTRNTIGQDLYIYGLGENGIVR